MNESDFRSRMQTPGPVPELGTGQLGADELARMKSIFQLVDDDKSGSIELPELRQVFAKLDLKMDLENASLLLKRFDQDKNGVLNFDEFCVVMSVVIALKKWFAAADLDDSRSISTKELKTILERLGFTLSSETLDSLAKVFDSDSSGEIEYQEFLNLVLYVREVYYVHQERLTMGFSRDSGWIGELLGAAWPMRKSVAAKLRSSEKWDFEPFLRLILSAILEDRTSAGTHSLSRKRWQDTGLSLKRRLRVKRDNLKAAQTMESKKPSADATMQVNQLSKDITLESGLYVDHEFPVNASVLPAKVAHRIVSWKRLHELSSNPQLFLDGIEEGDVIQGSLGNCWFLSALSVLATSGTAFIQANFVATFPKEGRYILRFFKNGEWKFVQIDDRVPCDIRGKPAFASCKDPNEFWVPLVEKAYAKLHGSYAAIEAGHVSEALVDLTGEAVENINLTTEKEDFTSEHLWAMLNRSIQESYLMGANILSNMANAEEQNAYGLLLNHSYSIIHCEEFKGHRLLRMRNPWGGTEWNGPWSDGSPEWTPEYQKHFNYEFENDGTFFMPFEWFIRFFNNIAILRLMTDGVGEVWTPYRFKQEWHGATAGGCIDNASWHQNSQYGVEVEEDSHVFVYLSQPDFRFHFKSGRRVGNSYLIEYPAIGVTVLEAETLQFKKLSIQPKDIVAVSTFVTSRDNSIEFKAVAGKKYVIVPSTLQPGIESSFHMLAYTQTSKSKIELIIKAPATATVHGNWKGQSAGGCTNYQSWIENPQYVLLGVDRPMTVEATLTQRSLSGTVKHISLTPLVMNPELYGRKVLLITRTADGKPPVYTNAESVSIQFQAIPEEGYALMPATFEPGEECEFDLVVHEKSNTSQLQLQPATEWSRSKISGAWASGMAGGCQNHPTYFENPIVNLVAHDRTLIVIRLCTVGREVQVPIGFNVHMLEANGKIGPMVLKSSFFMDHTVVCHLTFPAGSYAVIPCSFEPGYLSPFTLECFASSHVDFRKQ